MRKSLFLIFVVMVMMCGSASASVSYSSFDRIITVTDEAGISLTEINSTLGNADALWKDGNVWYCNGSIRSVDSTIYINSTDGTELRLFGNRLASVQLYGDSADDTFIINDVTISSWDASTSMYDIKKGSHKFYPSSSIDNVTFRGGRVELHGDVSINNVDAYGMWQIELMDYHGESKTVNNIYMEDSYPGDNGFAFLIFDSDNIIADNIVINHTISQENHPNSFGSYYDTESAGIGFMGTVGCSLYNFNIYNCDDYLSHYTYYTSPGALTTTESENNKSSYFHAENGTITGASNAGISPTGQSRFLSYKNITIVDVGHNGLDIHPAFNLTADDISITNSTSNNILVTGAAHTNPAAYNITLSNFSLYEGGFLISDNTSDIRMYDSTIHNGSIKASDNWGAEGVVLINVSTTYSGDFSAVDNYILLTELSTNNVETATVVDCSAYRIGRYLLSPSRSPVMQNWINVGYTTLSYKNNITLWYYPNITVQNTSGVVIPNATVTFTEDTLNGWGESQSTFITDASGKLYDSGNRSNWAAFPDVYYNQAGSLTTSYTGYANASYSGVDGNSTLIDLSTSDYSSDPASLSGQEYVIILDVVPEGSGEPTPESPVNPTFVAVGGGFAVIFAIGSWINQRRKRF